MSKIITLSRLYTLPPPPAADRRTRSNMARRNSRSKWTCDMCQAPKTGSDRWYKLRLRTRASEPAALLSGLKTKWVRACSTCAHTVFLCGACGKWHAVDTEEAITRMPMRVGSKRSVELPICDTCAAAYIYVCDGCGKPTVGEAAFRLEHGGRTYRFCQKCADTCTTCADCGVRLPPSMLSGSSRRVCQECLRQNEPELESHSFKPTARFYHSTDKKEQAAPPRTNLYLGVELELDGGHRGRKLTQALKQYDYLYCKRDGSLSSVGIELVSHPATLGGHRETFRWADILSLVRSFNYDGNNNTCGLHIHASREFLDPRYASLCTSSSAAIRRTLQSAVKHQGEPLSMNALKLLAFVHKHRAKFETLARRSGNHYAAFTDGVTDAGSVLHSANFRQMAKLADPSQTHQHRYQALNFMNRTTIEWRMFRGTADVTILMASLELVEAATRFAMRTSSVTLLGRRCWSEFKEWLKTEPYATLRSYMKEKQV